MKAMPTETSPSHPRLPARLNNLAIAAGAVIFGISIATSAAIQTEPPAEGSSSVLPAYSATFRLVTACWRLAAVTMRLCFCIILP